MLDESHLSKKMNLLQSLLKQDKEIVRNDKIKLNIELLNTEVKFLVIIDRVLSVKDLRNQLTQDITEILKQIGTLSKNSKKIIQVDSLQRNGFLILERYNIGDVFEQDDVVSVSYQLVTKNVEKKTNQDLNRKDISPIKTKKIKKTIETPKQEKLPETVKVDVKENKNIQQKPVEKQIKKPVENHIEKPKTEQKTKLVLKQDKKEVKKQEKPKQKQHAKNEQIEDSPESNDDNLLIGSEEDKQNSDSSNLDSSSNDEESEPDFFSNQ